MEEQNWEKVTNSVKRVGENCEIVKGWHPELVNCIDISVGPLTTSLENCSLE